MPDPDIADLGSVLRSRRRKKNLSLRDLADETGVSLNTLSRVERGHVPDLKNFQLIIEWLDVPAEHFLEGTPGSSTPEVIARHLKADRRLPSEAASKIAELVEDMYHKLTAEQPTFSLHLRAAKTFTPGASVLLAEMLDEIQTKLQSSPRQ